MTQEKDEALAQIAKVLNGLPSVTHGEVTPNLDSILFASVPNMSWNIY